MPATETTTITGPNGRIYRVNRVPTSSTDSVEAEYLQTKGPHRGEWREVKYGARIAHLTLVVVGRLPWGTVCQAAARKLAAQAQLAFPNEYPAVSASIESWIAELA